MNGKITVELEDYEVAILMILTGNRAHDINVKLSNPDDTYYSNIVRDEDRQEIMALDRRYRDDLQCLSKRFEALYSKHN